MKALKLEVFLSVTLALACMFNCTKYSTIQEQQDIHEPKLKDVYKGDFYIGTGLDSTQIYGGDQKAFAIMKEQFNAITAENAMKWQKLQPESGRYYFTVADSFVSLGEKNQMYIVGHVLIWHHQTPRWVFHDSSGNLVDRETLLARIRDHIHTVVGRYKGRVNSWDVVNEAIGDNGEWRENLWYQIVGKDYVQKAFEFAREADPDAKLLYNDYSLTNGLKRNTVIEMVRDLQGKGVKIDEIGMQGHYHLDYPHPDSLEKSIVEFSKLGVKVAITEHEINVLPRPDKRQLGADIALSYEMQKRYNPFTEFFPDSMQQKLADRYVDYFKVLLKHKDKVSRVTVWGIHDGQSWTNFWPIRGRTNYPLLFDREYQPKAAFDALIEVGKKNK